MSDAFVIVQWSNISAYFQDKEIQKEEKQALISQIDAVLTMYGYDHIVLLNKRGEVVFIANEKHLGAMNGSTLKLFHAALTAKKIIFGSFYHCQLHKTVHIDLVVPVVSRRDHKDEVVGGIIFMIDPDKFLYPLIQSWPTPSPTAETLLVEQVGDAVLFLNEPRHTKAAPLTLKFPLTDKRLPGAGAVEGWQGALEGNDYRGVPVLAVTKAIPDTPWVWPAGPWVRGDGGGGGAGEPGGDWGRGRSTPGRGDRAGAAAGLLVHHRDRWWTATRAQARDAPGTLSQCPSHLRLPLTGSLPLKRPSEKPLEKQ